MHASAGFQYTGLFPLKKKIIKQHGLAISETFNQPTTFTPLPTEQPLPSFPKPAKAASRFDRYKALHKGMNNEKENEVESFFQEKNQFM